ncbi:MAG: GNAT family N-acetyltransferase [Methanococcaceae archaeon]
MVGSIREATLNDFDEIFKLLEQLWPDKELSREVLMQVFSAALKAPYNIYLCTEINGRIAGFCSLVITESLMVDGLAGHINELVIDEFFRGTGIGTELLEAAIAAAKSRGCKRIGLNSAFFRKEAHEFYLNRGLIKSAYFFSKEL